MASPTNDDAIQSVVAEASVLPSGTTAAFLEESRDTPSITAILFILSLVFVVCLLRCFARAYFVKRFGWDDALAIISFLLLVAFVVFCVILIHEGSGRHFVYIQYFLTNEQQNETETNDFIAHIIYTTALLICRLSGLTFYARICSGADYMTRSIRAAAIFIIAAYLPQLFLIVFHCLPVTSTWPYSFQPEVGNYKCLQWGTVYVTNSTISLICDFILFIIPSVIIARMHITPFRKFKLCLVLMPGILVIAISVARMYLVIVGQWTPDESWSYNILLSVEVAEIGCTLIALSIPSLKPLMGGMFSFLDRNASVSDGSRGIRSRLRFQKVTWPWTKEATLELEDRSGSGSNNGAMSLTTDEEKAYGPKFANSNSNIAGWEPNAFQYEAHAFASPGERRPSLTSDKSRRALIQRRVDYSVTND